MFRIVYDIDFDFDSDSTYESNSSDSCTSDSDSDSENEMYRVRENYVNGKLTYYPHLEAIPLTIKLQDPSGRNIPDVYDPRKLRLLSRHQVAFWDETHPKTIVSTGKIKNLPDKDIEVRFPRNSEGSLNIVSGFYGAPSEKIVSVKYESEIRLCLGVASVLMPDGKVIGKRAKLIDYTGKLIISEEEHERRINDEIERVRRIKGKQWITKTYPMHYDENNIYKNDPHSVFKQIGNVACCCLKRVKKIFVVKDLMKYCGKLECECC